MRFILSQFKAKKTSAAALHQLSSVLTGLRLDGGHGQQQQRYDGAGRAAWGCICEARKVLSNLDKEVAEKGTEIERGIREFEESTPIGEGDGEVSKEQVEEIKRERWKEKEALDRKHRDVQFAVAQALNAACNNPPVTALFRGDQMESIRKSFKPWCNLTESFAPEETDLEKYQIDTLGFVPKGRMRTPPLGKLCKEITENMKSTSPRADFETKREEVRRRLQGIVDRCESLPEGTELHVFGSSKNGFGAPNSDLDMCLALPPGGTLPDPALAMGVLAEDLEKEGMHDVNARLTARIPIIMFEDNITDMECDISLQNPLAVRNTGLLATYAHCDPRVRELAYAVKRWVKAREINSPSDGTLSSYGYILMLLHYLQRTKGFPLVPNLQGISDKWKGDINKIYEGDSSAKKDYVKHPTEPDTKVNCYYYKSKGQLEQGWLKKFCARNNNSAGGLLAGFFHYYGFDFDFRKHVISLAPQMLEKDLMGEVRGSEERRQRAV